MPVDNRLDVGSTAAVYLESNEETVRFLEWQSIELMSRARSPAGVFVRFVVNLLVTAERNIRPSFRARSNCFI